MNYCKVGDLAITVQAYNPDNIGKLVWIRSSAGVGTWPDLKGPQKIWHIETATPGVPLVYSIDDVPYTTMIGEAPDCFLRPIRPDEQSSSQVHQIQGELEYV
jgi:hypothetical protein